MDVAESLRHRKAKMFHCDLSQGGTDRYDMRARSASRSSSTSSHFVPPSQAASLSHGAPYKIKSIEFVGLVVTCFCQSSTGLWAKRPLMHLKGFLKNRTLGRAQHGT
jgi:hypothetical protein